MFERCALLLLAGGLSSRFEAGDKLMAPLGTRTVLDHAADRLLDTGLAGRIAVVGADQEARRQLLKARGYHVVDNPDPARGQGYSLAIGAAYIRDHSDADAVIIQLADMPFVEDAHLCRLAGAFRSGAGAVITGSSGIHSPPALFARCWFDMLAGLKGDQGALRVFRACPNGIIIEAPSRQGLDIDTVADLEQAGAE